MIEICVERFLDFCNEIVWVGADYICFGENSITQPLQTHAFNHSCVCYRILMVLLDSSITRILNVGTPIGELLNGELARFLELHMAEYDIVVVGGGHNGLTVAAYFSMFGYHTAVVERSPYVGGGVVTREVMPGVRQDINSMVHGLIQANPMIKDDELGLQSQFGLQYVRQDAIFGSAWLDGAYLMLHMDIRNTVKSIQRFSKKDAETYRKLMDWAKPMMESALESSFVPPPTTSTTLAQLESTAVGEELLQLMFLDIVEIVDEWFDDPHLQTAFVKLATDFAHLPPKTPGTAILPLLELTLIHKYGYAIPRGGSGVLSESLARCIKAWGRYTHL